VVFQSHLHDGVRSYRPDVDGLRALAVLAVIGYHFFPAWVKGGFVGVDIFFVISGFLIGGILLEALHEHTFSFLDFYARRIRRILPALILVMAAVLAFGWFALLPDDYRNLGKHTAGGGGFISNIMLWKEAGYFDVAAERKPLLHLWSLGVEEQFYIFFPLFLWFLWAKGLRASIFLSAFLFMSLAINLSVYKKYAVFDFYMPITRFWEFAVGALLALAQCKPMPASLSRLFLKLDAWLAGLCFEQEKPENDGRTLRHFLSALGILILVVVVFKTKIEHFPGKRALWPVLGAALVILAGFRQTPVGWFNQSPLARRPLVAIGLISYPLYLWHWPLLSYTLIILGEMPGRGFRIGLLAVAFVLAALTYFFVERPIRFGKRAKGAKAIVLAVLLAILSGAGAAIYWREGMKTRKATENILIAADALQAIGHASDWNFRNEECRKRFDLSQEEIYEERCLYHNAKAETTILLLGDSHASAPFDSIADFNARLGINTWMLHSGNPFLPLNQQIAYLDNLLQRIDLKNNKAISKVFIIERGVVRVEGKDVDGADCLPLGEEGFYQRMQYFTDRLREAGKEVFIVAETPVLHTDIKNMLPAQPLRPPKQIEPEYKSEVLKHQGKYLNALKRVRGAKIIDSLNAFCPQETCMLFDENSLPLYSDNDHLSRWVGGRFLVERVLKPYLKP
jgi:peptidoglycan/LPS O-acetylase OafA/YrhL